MNICTQKAICLPRGLAVPEAITDFRYHSDDALEALPSALNI